MWILWPGAYSSSATGSLFSRIGKYGCTRILLPRRNTIRTWALSSTATWPPHYCSCIASWNLSTTNSWNPFKGSSLQVFWAYPPSIRSLLKDHPDIGLSDGLTQGRTLLVSTWTDLYIFYALLFDLLLTSPSHSDIHVYHIKNQALALSLQLLRLFVHLLDYVSGNLQKVLIWGEQKQLGSIIPHLCDHFSQTGQFFYATMIDLPILRTGVFGKTIENVDAGEKDWIQEMQ